MFLIKGTFVYIFKWKTKLRSGGEGNIRFAELGHHELNIEANGRQYELLKHEWIAI